MGLKCGHECNINIIDGVFILVSGGFHSCTEYVLTHEQHEMGEQSAHNLRIQSIETTQFKLKERGSLETSGKLRS